MNGQKLTRGYCVESWLRIEIGDEPLLVWFGFVEVKLILTFWHEDGLGRTKAILPA